VTAPVLALVGEAADAAPAVTLPPKSQLKTMRRLLAFMPSGLFESQGMAKPDFLQVVDALIAADLPEEEPAAAPWWEGAGVEVTALAAPGAELLAGAAGEVAAAIEGFLTA
jgi:hypothetical protein